MHRTYKPLGEWVAPTRIASAVECEERYAYESLYADMPTVPKPAAFIYGTVMHVVGERIWRGGFHGEQTAVGFAHGYLGRVIRGECGPRGDSFPPVEIRWLLLHEEKKFTAEERKREIAQRMQRYHAATSPTVSAIYKEYESLRQIVERVEVEFDFKGKGVVITASSGRKYPLSGKADRILFTRDHSYAIFDDKTGQTVLMKDRRALLQEAQPVHYVYAATQVFGRPPHAFYFQPIAVSAKNLADFGAETLKRQRIPMELPDPNRIRDFADLVDDIRTATEMIVTPSKCSAEERRVWEPRSHLGKLSGIKENVVLGRFLARVGQWCRSCPFVELCQEENADAWAEFQEKQSGSAALRGEKTAAVVRVKPEDSQLSLFGEPTTRTPRLRKSAREIKAALLATGRFLPQHKIFAAVRKLYLRILPEERGGAPCPCRKAKLWPLHIFTHVGEVLLGNMSPDDVLRKCPWPECPYRSDRKTETPAA